MDNILLPDLNLSFYRFENFFKIYKDDHTQELFFNIIKSINIFPTNNSDIEIEYYISNVDTWYLISYKHYKTIELWWLICCYNNIKNPMVLPELGSPIKILRPEYVGFVLQELQRQLNR